MSKHYVLSNLGACEKGERGVIINSIPIRWLNPAGISHPTKMRASQLGNGGRSGRCGTVEQSKPIVGDLNSLPFTLTAFMK